MPPNTVTQNPSSQTSLTEGMVPDYKHLLSQAENKIACIMEISSALSSTHNLDELLNLIMEKVTILMDADRSTLFLIDEDTGELWSKVMQAQYLREIRLKPGEGIAGWVAQNGTSLNIKNAYKDPRFNSEIDSHSGYRTHSILCQPVRNQHREIMGVIQVLNKRDGYFTVEDENLLSATAAQAAISIANSRLYLSAISQNFELRETQELLYQKINEINLLYAIEREINTSHGLDKLLESICEKTLDIIEASACAITVRHEYDNHTMYILNKEKQDGDNLFRIVGMREDEGVSAVVISKGVSYISNTSENANKQDSAILDSGLIVNSVIAVPIFAEERTIGCIEIMNKSGWATDGTNAKFDDDDLKLLTLIGGQISSAIAVHLFRERQEKENQLQAIGQMLSGVLHDFKTPATIISGYVQLMANQNDSEKRIEYADSILKQFDHLNQMTKEILAFARGDSSILLRKIFLHNFLDEIKQNIGQELTDRGVNLTIEDNYRGACKMDEIKMKRVFSNLARNAAEAMPNGGEFKIAVKKINGHVKFLFSDSGHGVPEDIRSRLFVPFVTSGKMNGTGLGLAIVKKIVEEHKGIINFTTSVDMGTTFEIAIPHESES